MKSSIPRLKLLFLALFGVSCALLWAFQVFYVWPRDRCEGHGGWWEPESRICGAPVLLSTITGRPFGTPRAPGGGGQPASRVAPGIHSTSPPR